jgi:hypothetical protein
MAGLQKEGEIPDRQGKPDEIYTTDQLSDGGKGPRTIIVPKEGSEWAGAEGAAKIKQLMDELKRRQV